MIAIGLAVAPGPAARADDKAPPPAPASKAAPPAARKAVAPVLVAAVPPAAETAPAHDPDAPPKWDDPTERAGRRQLYLGLRYRGVVVPQFLINLFVSEGRNVLVHTAGIELDVRRDHFSLVPHLVYTHYFLDDTLFLEKGKDANNPGSYSFVNSSLHAIYVGIDMLWSFRLNRYLDFEAGLGVGIGYVFGDLVNNWVIADPQGQLVSSNGMHLAPCTMFIAGTSCDRANHNNASADKVNRYVEPNWFGGGSVPTFYARIGAPLLGLRIKPMRDLALRIQVGLSLTEGFMFGGGLDFRLPGT